MELSDRMGKELFEWRELLNWSFDKGFFHYNEQLFTDMLNDVEKELEKRAYPDLKGIE